LTVKKLNSRQDGKYQSTQQNKIKNRLVIYQHQQDPVEYSY